MNPDWRNRYDAMIELAERAGGHALRYFDTGVAVETKTDQSPVTIADRESEQLLREALAQRFAGDGFLGEEYGDQPGTSGYRWIIDPIDGTRSFIRGIPLWGTLVALEHFGEMVAGVCRMPAINITYRALRGDGAYRDSRRIRVSDVAELDKALMSYSSFSFFKAAGKTDAFIRMLEATERSRAYSDFYGFMLVAQGSVDVMVEQGVHIWDIAPLKVIVEEAGGTFTDWRGKNDLYRPEAVATNGRLHAATLRILESD